MDTDKKSESSITTAPDTNRLVPSTSKDVDVSNSSSKKNKSIDHNDAKSSIDDTPVTLLGKKDTAKEEIKINLKDFDFTLAKFPALSIENNDEKRKDIKDSNLERIGECDAVFSFMKRETGENPRQRRKIMTTVEVYYKIIKETIDKLEQITSLASRARNLLVTENIELSNKREELRSLIHGQEIEIDMLLLELKKIHIVQDFGQENKVSKQTQETMMEEQGAVGISY